MSSAVAMASRRPRRRLRLRLPLTNFGAVPLGQLGQERPARRQLRRPASAASPPRLVAPRPRPASRRPPSAPFFLAKILRRLRGRRRCTVPCGASRAVIFQYSSVLNASISRSRSTISLHRHRLHPAGAQAARPPSCRAGSTERVADDAVEDAPGLLGVRRGPCRSCPGCASACWTAVLGDLVEA